MKILYTLLLFLFCVQLNHASDLVLHARVGTALNTVTLHKDTSFTKATNTNFKEGTLFEIIGESKLEHEDASQNQKFKWFKVKTEDGRSGWIFGDGIAVVMPYEFVDEELKIFHKRKCSFSNGFENSVSWVASVDGRDNFHSQDFMNPLYKEYYLVITNDRGRSVHMQYAGLSARGETTLLNFKMFDISGDKVPELILINANKATGSTMEDRELNIYSFQAGTLQKVLEEQLTLRYNHDQPAPSLYKFVEIEEKSVRIAYVDYVSCDSYNLPYTADVDKNANERCLEYVTYTYIWNPRLNELKQFYAPSRTSPEAHCQYDISIRKAPDLKSALVAGAKRGQSLKVIKHIERFIKVKGEKEVEHYFYVQLGNGQLGYLPAKAINFTGCEYAVLLNQYYQNPPLSKSDWKSDQQFFRILNEGRDSAAME